MVTAHRQQEAVDRIMAFFGERLASWPVMLPWEVQVRT